MFVPPIKTLPGRRPAAAKARPVAGRPNDGRRDDDAGVGCACGCWPAPAPAGHDGALGGEGGGRARDPRDGRDAARDRGRPTVSNDASGSPSFTSGLSLPDGQCELKASGMHRSAVRR